ncbi:MAG: hypothetical protein ACOY33_00130 [Pseudomonadota bacterium]
MQIRKFLATSALYLSAACISVPVLADDTAERRKHAEPVSGVETRPLNHGNERLRFTVRERESLDLYAQQRAAAVSHGKQKPLPPGLQKKAARGGELPPGWKKKLAAGNVLSPEVYQAGQPLPKDVKKKLPPDPDGTITLDIDGEVVRVVQKTREIVDILRRER